jgi:hypothetical protein
LFIVFAYRNVVNQISDIDVLSPFCMTDIAITRAGLIMYPRFYFLFIYVQFRSISLVDTPGFV